MPWRFTMRITRFRDPSAFLERARPFLLQSEVEHNLLLSVGAVAATLDDGYWATVDDGAAVVACAVRRPPYKAVISRGTRSAVECLVKDLAARYPDLPQVVGPEPDVSDFAALWAARTGIPSVQGMRQRLFETREVQQPRTVPDGHFRLAEDSDVPAAIEWCAAFIAEAIPGDPTDAARHAKHRIATRSLYVWEDGKPVSMAGWAGRTTRGVRVNLVYTPPAYRGRGYASACVARLTQHLLDEGLSFCCLYTDLANQTANRIYERMGYRPVCDFTDYVLNSRKRESPR